MITEEEEVKGKERKEKEIGALCIKRKLLLHFEITEHDEVKTIL